MLVVQFDPWAGSYYVEFLTHEIAHNAWKLIQEVEELGGMYESCRNRYSKNAHRRGCRPANRQGFDSNKDIDVLGLN